MKSNFLSKVDLMRSDEFKRDMEVLMSLDDDLLLRLPQYAANIRLTRTSEEEEKAAEQASKDLEAPRAKLDHALRLSLFFVRQFMEKGDASSDNPEDIVEDLTGLGFVPSGKRGSFASLLAKLKEVTQGDLERKVRQLRYASSGLPALQSISTVTDLRVVFDREFRSTTPIASYAPECEAVLPVTVVALEFDEGPTKQVYFQADRHSLGLLIGNLQAAEKELDKAAEIAVSLRERRDE